MRRLLPVLMILGVIIAAVTVAATQPLPLPSAPLFAPIEIALLRTANVPPEQVGTLRTRLAQFNSAALGQLRNGALTLNLFQDVSLTAVGDVQQDSTARGITSTVWTGSITGEPHSNVIMLTDMHGNMDLRVLMLGRNYFVQSLGGGAVRISEIDPSAGRYTQDGQPINDAVLYTPTEAEQREISLNRASPRADDGAIIDVMVVYTPAAAALLGGEAQTRLAIESTAALANVTYQNSGVDFRIRLVHVMAVDYVEQGLNDLNRLSSASDGHMDIIHQWRNEYAADLVALIPGTAVANRNYCGIAHLPLSMPAPNSAFSITEALCISDITFAHELGHNMGKAHDHANGFGAIHPYAYGYQDASTGSGDYGDWVTVMAYSTGGDCPATYTPGICPAIAYWSDKNATYLGKPLGSAGVNGENNVQSLNETALSVANYRISGDGGIVVPTAVPTLAPIPTPDSTPANNRVLNGSFEFDNDADGLPDGWRWGAVSGARDCSTSSLPDGHCRLRLKPGAKIIQNLPVSGLAATDTLDIALMSFTKPANTTVCARARVTVKYVNPLAGVNGNGKEKFPFPLPVAPTNQWASVSGTITLADTPSSIKIELISSCRKAWFIDAVSVIPD